MQPEDGAPYDGLTPAQRLELAERRSRQPREVEVDPEDTFTGTMPPVPSEAEPEYRIEEPWFELNGSPLHSLEVDGVRLPITPRIRDEAAKWVHCATARDQAAHVATLACASLIDAAFALDRRDWRALIVLTAALRHTLRATHERIATFAGIGKPCCPAPGISELPSSRSLGELSPAAMQPSHHHGVFAVARHSMAIATSNVLKRSGIMQPWDPWDQVTARCVDGERRATAAWEALAIVFTERDFWPHRHWSAWPSAFAFLSGEMALAVAQPDAIRPGEVSTPVAIERGVKKSVIYRLRDERRNPGEFRAAGARRLLGTDMVVFDERKLRAVLRRNGAAGLT